METFLLVSCSNKVQSPLLLCTVKAKKMLTKTPIPYGYQQSFLIGLLWVNKEFIYLLTKLYQVS